MHQKVFGYNTTNTSSGLWRTKKHLEKGCLWFTEHVTLPTGPRSCIYFNSQLWKKKKMIPATFSRQHFLRLFPGSIPIQVHYLYSHLHNKYNILQLAKLKTKDTELRRKRSTVWFNTDGSYIVHLRYNVHQN